MRHSPAQRFDQLSQVPDGALPFGVINGFHGSAILALRLTLIETEVRQRAGAARIG
jgi:hypothetical protein